MQVDFKTLQKFSEIFKKNFDIGKKATPAAFANADSFL